MYPQEFENLKTAMELYLEKTDLVAERITYDPQANRAMFLYGLNDSFTKMLVLSIVSRSEMLWSIATTIDETFTVEDVNSFVRVVKDLFRGTVDLATPSSNQIVHDLLMNILEVLGMERTWEAMIGTYFDSARFEGVVIEVIKEFMTNNRFLENLEDEGDLEGCAQVDHYLFDDAVEPWTDDPMSEEELEFFVTSNTVVWDNEPDEDEEEHNGIIAQATEFMWDEEGDERDNL